MKTAMMILWLVPYLILAEQLVGSDLESVAVSRVVSITDGDTFRVDIDHWPAIISDNMPIRIAGIDCPEMNRSDSAKAREARDFVEVSLLSSQVVTLRNIRRGKYFRIAAEVYVDSLNLGDLLMEAGLCEPYRR